jgi:hypothetical protein
MKKTITVKKAKFVKPKKKDKEYNQKQLKEGIKVEKEHSKQKKVQKIIAENHLDESKDYYKKLKKVEKSKKRK